MGDLGRTKEIHAGTLPADAPIDNTVDGQAATTMPSIVHSGSSAGVCSCSLPSNCFCSCVCIRPTVEHSEGCTIYNSPSKASTQVKVKSEVRSACQPFAPRRDPTQRHPLQNTTMDTTPLSSLPARTLHESEPVHRAAQEPAQVPVQPQARVPHSLSSLLNPIPDSNAPSTTVVSPVIDLAAGEAQREPSPSLALQSRAD